MTARVVIDTVCFQPPGPPTSEMFLAFTHGENTRVVVRRSFSEMGDLFL
jgi:hypothetical protein